MTDLAAIVRVTPEVLQQLLQLPEDSYIDNVQMRDDIGVIYLRVRGAGWPVVPGTILPTVSGICRADINADGSVQRVSIDWGFPKKEEA